jgi:small subunit ribosomal protein S8e
MKGGGRKQVLLSTNIANLTIAKGKTQKAKITNVIETPQNRFLARQNILMKGALIDTSLGKAKITNRPSQEGQVNATLVKEQ